MSVAVVVYRAFLASHAGPANVRPGLDPDRRLGTDQDQFAALDRQADAFRAGPDREEVVWIECLEEVHPETRVGGRGSGFHVKQEAPETSFRKFRL